MYTKRIFSKGAIQGIRKLCFSNPISSSLKVIPFAISIAHCSSEPPKKLEFPDPKTLTHEFLLKQASGVAVNSAFQLLNQAICAMVDVAELYKSALNDQISLIEECQSNMGNSGMQQDLSDLMVVSRANVNKYKNRLIEMETLLEYVEKLVVSTTETSFLTGAEYASSTLSEHLYNAKEEVKKTKESIGTLEEEYLRLQKNLIEDTGGYERRKKG